MLSDENIKLKLIEKEDLELIVDWRNSAYNEFCEYPLSKFGQEAWFKKYVSNNEFLFIIYKSKHKIGMIGLYNIDYRNKNAEFGRFIINEKFRGKGYGNKALILILDYAFKHLNLNRIYLDVFENNIKAINLYEKVNFKKEGIKNQHVYKNGEYNNLVYMAILKGDYI